MLLMSGVCSHFLCVTYSDVELHVAPFDESCLSGETFIFWELHGKYSIFQSCCWFEVAARGRAMR
jgi:hypothetical protein